MPDGLCWYFFDTYRVYQAERVAQIVADISQL